MRRIKWLVSLIVLGYVSATQLSASIAIFAFQSPSEWTIAFGIITCVTNAFAVWLGVLIAPTRTWRSTMILALLAVAFSVILVVSIPWFSKLSATETFAWLTGDVVGAALGGAFSRFWWEHA